MPGFAARSLTGENCLRLVRSETQQIINYQPILFHYFLPKPLVQVIFFKTIKHRRMSGHYNLYLRVLLAEQMVHVLGFLFPGCCSAATYHLAETAIREVARSPHSRGDAATSRMSCIIASLTMTTRISRLSSQIFWAARR